MLAIPITPAMFQPFTTLHNGDFEQAAIEFRTNHNAYMAGFCEALAGLPQDAIPDWEPLLHKRPQHWCFHAFGLLKGTLGMPPSFLGIRLFLEMDLWTVIRAGRLDYADNITYFSTVLQDIHLEAPKLLAKPWLYNGFPQRAYTLLMQGLSRLPHDPEAFYHLGHYYRLIGDTAQAQLMWQEALMISPQFWPAHIQLNATWH
jgi:tetratricopeptide (TPR) repeat protein